MLLSAGAAWADVSGGQVVCLGRYALCSSAQCAPIENDVTHVSCACELPPDGLNIGNSSCQDRARALTSTFSLWDLTETETKAAKHSLACTGENANAWAFCLDATCSVEDGKATCRCALKPASDFYTFTPACPSSDAARAEACGKTWSGALLPELLSGYSQLWSFYDDIPKLKYCPG